MSQRRIARTVTVPPLAPGFVGPGHLAAQVVSPEDFALNDPFIMLADDHLDIGDRPVGGPHPHAGFETVTLILDGAIYDRDEGGVIKAGEVQWMTAGSGIIHGENVATRGEVRLLQLWLTLPRRERWTTPAFRDIHADAIPVRREKGVEVRVYSGTSGALRSTTPNHVPVTMVEITTAPHAEIDQEIPSSYNGFVYVIRGSVRAGEDATLLNAGQVGWLDRPQGEASSTLRAVAGEEGARLVLYSGQPQGDHIVSRGPFIGDSEDDIRRLYAEYRAGRFQRMSELARAKRPA
ncbi:MAG: pirin family protein [Acidobacteriota bacterium]|nr:pirin family protein [Acidobacteriota bacterium]